METKIQEEFVWGTIVGCAVGAAAALLLTPLSGAQLRKQVQKSVQSINGAPAVIKKRLQRGAHALSVTVKKKTPVKKRVKTKVKAGKH